MGLLRLGGRGGLAGADGPDRLVGDDRLGHLFLGQPGQAAADLGFQHFLRLAGFAFGQGFADADNRLERGRVDGRGLFGQSSASDSFWYCRRSEWPRMT